MPADAIRGAVCALLDADREVAGVLHGRIAFRDVRAFTTFPFVAIGHTVERPGGAPDVENHIVTVHLWMRPGEDARARRIGRSIRRALDEGGLRVRGADVLSFRHEASSLRAAPELEALHATSRYRLRLSRLGGSGLPPAGTHHAVP